MKSSPEQQPFSVITHGLQTNVIGSQGNPYGPRLKLIEVPYRLDLSFLLFICEKK